MHLRRFCVRIHMITISFIKQFLRYLAAPISRWLHKVKKTKIKSTWERKHDLHHPKCCWFPQFFNVGTSTKYLRRGILTIQLVSYLLLQGIAMPSIWNTIANFSRSDQIVVILAWVTLSIIWCDLSPIQLSGWFGMYCNAYILKDERCLPCQENER